MTWNEAFDELGVTVASRAQLLAAGARPRYLTAAVRSGYLLRVRRDHYARPDAPRSVLQSVRVGGRLACLSTLSHAGIFAIDDSRTHIHLDRTASRLRHPNDARRPLPPNSRRNITMHWSPLDEADAGSEVSVGVKDALAQVIQCQDERHAIASLDNALFLKAIDLRDLREIFANCPQRFAGVLPRVDGRAEAGQETMLRLLLEDAGLHCDLQVTFPGIGRVDLVVEGRVVVEADSRLAHDGWELHVRDRNRDIDVARLGYPSIRPAYQRTMQRPGDVLEAVRGLLAACT
ncbi:very-short-patch-repair endonuclease [Salinibacterium sp. CAN_S4]|uniref:type IV toxin-antitoxin system AbiEi family antitoxin domain-containing protein n=1 Tax=Salinibacterium sp. CAN_S4 TaxID=2787727 RepID=UPI0018F03CAA